MVLFCYELTAKRPFSATFKAVFILWIIAADMTKVLEWLCMVSEKHTPPPMVCPEDILFYLTWFLNTSLHHFWWINYMSRNVFTKSWSTVKFTLCGFHQWKKIFRKSHTNYIFHFKLFPWCNIYIINRSLGALRATTSSWLPFGPA